MVKTLEFLLLSAALFVFLAAGLTGVSCVRHGDVGPYPELDFMWAVPPASMLFSFMLLQKKEDE